MASLSCCWNESLEELTATLFRGMEPYCRAESSADPSPFSCPVCICMSIPEPPRSTPPDGLRGLKAKGWMPRLSPLKRMFPESATAGSRGKLDVPDLLDDHPIVQRPCLLTWVKESPIVLGRGYFLRILYLSTAPKGLPRAFSASVYRALYHRSCRKVWLDGLKLWFSKIL
ncbi:hypothetical protein EYF80_005549 [Liparis tanakae]|uniref:Uncharacterized protein n=1 Tax=Liparis tanakae TaxID=230148 RepID=A0A4Z2J433_9TELE|nr:hypothetical protein EYF80_005549 [Liparis tanakae]